MIKQWKLKYVKITVALLFIFILFFFLMYNVRNKLLYFDD